MQKTIWTFNETFDTGTDITGFSVEAVDGSIGSIHEATHETDQSFVVVDTGPWIFGKKVLLPAGTVERIDAENEQVYVDRSKEEIENAPEFDDARKLDPAYHEAVGAYYFERSPSASLNER